jgi:type IV pilus assembly protein PilB
MAVRDTAFEEPKPPQDAGAQVKVLKHKFSRRVGEILLSEGLINEQQLRLGLERQKQTGAFLVETLVSLGFVKSEVVGRYLDQATGFPFVDLSQTEIDLKIARSIPENLARRKLVLPFAQNGEEVSVALADPLNITTVDDIASRIGLRVVPHLAFSFDLEDAIARTFDARHKAEAVLAEMGELQIQDIAEDDLMGLASEAPIVRLVQGMLESAVNLGASDIHIEPLEDNVRVRFRLDGLLFDQMTIPRVNLAAAVSRLKVLSSMNIAERRRPQDGRFAWRDDANREFDFRVSIMPVQYGEKVVMRILEKSNVHANIDKLGFLPEQRTAFEKFIKKQHGIVLVTGPTGSGKSTTLFAALQKINDPNLNINTIEDPVEYHIHGVNQVSVNPKIGVTFANGLRTLVRQDPDIIMVGEIRDAETAEIAIQAALTGHLVLSTLHTNDAPGALVRLQNMGVEPFLVSSAVLGVLGQRLVRTICTQCKESEIAPIGLAEEFNLPSEPGKPPVIYRGRGCPKCGGRGMKGRTAVYEVMPMSDTLRALVLKSAAGSEVMDQARVEGMMSMREAGIKKVIEGITTPEEVLRVLYTED